MKHVLTLLAAATLSLLPACSTPTASSSPSSATASQGSNRQGSSFADAIVIHASNESDGVRKEYEWLREHLPEFRVVGQSLGNQGGKAYDILHLVSPSGEKRDLFFDITEFFGKL